MFMFFRTKENWEPNVFSLFSLFLRTVQESNRPLMLAHSFEMLPIHVDLFKSLKQCLPTVCKMLTLFESRLVSRSPSHTDEQGICCGNFWRFLMLSFLVFPWQH